jgi:hypothetical protein
MALDRYRSCVPRAQSSLEVPAWGANGAGIRPFAFLRRIRAMGQAGTTEGPPILATTVTQRSNQHGNG